MLLNLPNNRHRPVDADRCLFPSLAYCRLLRGAKHDLARFLFFEGYFEQSRVRRWWVGFFVSGQKGVSVEKESCLCVVPLSLSVGNTEAKRRQNVTKLTLAFFFINLAPVVVLTLL